jgi:TolB-like protein
MPDEAAEASQSEIAHVLTMSVVGGAKLSADEQTKHVAELNAVLGQSTRFCVADAAGKLTRLPADDGVTLLFFNSEPEAAMECAVETAMEVKAHPEMKVRMGIHSGAVDRIVDLSEQANGASIAMARQVMEHGDAGHILLSKRIALELASMARWNTHLYELGDVAGKDGEKISLVNFHADWAGNAETPSKLTRTRAVMARRDKMQSLGRRVPIAAMYLSILAAAAGIFFYAKNTLHIEPAAAPRPADKSIAVLPFVDLSPARDQEYLCDGTSDEILDALAKTPGLRVIARGSSFAFKGKNADAREIGRKLNVATVLEGTLQRDGNHVRANAQLFNARNGAQILAQTLEKEMPDASALPDEIARSVVNALKIKIAAVPGVRRQANAQAYDFYLEGLFFSNKSGEEELRHSIEVFQVALTKNQRLARAWSGIAKDWILLGDSHVRPLDAYPRAENAAMKALAIDDHEAEAHAYLGEARRVSKWDVNGGEAELKRALELNPNFAPGHMMMSILQAALGNRRAQLDELDAAARLDPLSPIIASAQVSAFVANDRLDDAFTAAKRTMEIDANYVYFEPALALVYREQGKLKEALEIYQRIEQTRNQPTAGLAITYARLGRKDDARRVVSQLIERANRYYFPGDQIASVFVALGENDEAFRWINRAMEERSATLAQIAFGREFRGLRSDARFADTLRKIGLDPARFTLDRQ